ncbi:MAG: hypothetical protein A2821_04665 [Candidatus Magasanikbacteria bacterium RIFCSPHIGHO2_01_FULL_41_23]|uniref:Uncharacterized protein n=1 Tax=Candidatus Magasanikbacteria bacterium RIFCSPLOWO2_01_FULL_40_15 TaxID=1798686 RepID=A0A1F6N4Z6_9BACT|nr:MAG: hypothetical protein A2821_04665 [Candidatus Magasanikbacteria bacterium RIFCSPHIGHO2_01_FULL_41_23]OGH67215.1 MAG: hypothetical protein A3C66_02975 [Candidatus Magasanikbacteria bacterium RIFCSPHIGHO2_02_FULL_41_35]OGH78750.1 MAG: hypothetical protein A2983_04615 [Candidatus Magasanikbacteria bacterium RIFCSPLOWO2_01_FULL_40_15]
MHEEQFELVKNNLLGHMRGLFEEIEESMARTHEEKYALLEDAVSNASDFGELQVAFGQWYLDHADDVNLEDEVEEIWDAVLNGRT